MGFEAFQNLPAADGEEQTPYQKIYSIVKDQSELYAPFCGYSLTDTGIQIQVSRIFDSNHWSEKSLEEIRTAINSYEGGIEVGQNNVKILKEIADKIGHMGERLVRSEFIHPSMGPLLSNDIDTEKLKVIRDALNGSEAEELQGLMRTYADLASEISVRRNLEDHEKGTCNPINFKTQYENLFRSLAEYESGDIMPLLTVALGEAQTLHRLLGLSAGYFINVADFEKQHPREYRQIFQAITDQNASSEDSPPVDKIKLWLQGWENSDDPDEKIKLYLEELNQSGKEKTSGADGVTSLPAAPTPETPSEGVSVPVAPAEESKAPPSRLRGLLQRILKTLGSAGAFVRKYPFPTTVVGAGVVALMAAAKNLGSAPVPKTPAAAPAPTTPPAAAPAPPTPAPANGTDGEALLTKLNESINWRSNPENFGDIPGQEGYKSLNLKTLLNHQGDGGLASSNAQISGGTREELIKLAEAANVDPEKIIRAYQTGYNDAYINAYASSANVTFEGNVTESVHAHAMTESLKAVKAVIAQEQEYKTSFLGRFETLVGNILPKGAPANAAEGPPMMQSSTPNPLATMMHGAVSRLEGVAHNVAIVAQHPAAQAAMRGLGVVGVVASVAKTVHEARSGHTALAVMNGAAAVATAAATVGMPPLAAFAGGVRVAAFVKDRSDEKTLGRVKDQKAALMTKRETLLQEPQTLATKAKIVMTNLALVTKTADVFAARKLNQGREGLAQTFENAQTITQTTMETATNAFQSAQERTANMFANLFNRQAAATL